MFPDLLVPTYDYREERDWSEWDADLYEEHAKECECSLCCHKPEECE